jgi:hypothetical protein
LALKTAIMLQMCILMARFSLFLQGVNSFHDLLMSRSSMGGSSIPMASHMIWVSGFDGEYLRVLELMP